MRTATKAILVAPAYGRSYKNHDEAVKDWEDGMDFICLIVGRNWGRYCSIRDFEPSKYLVEIRSDRYRGVATHYKCNPEENPK